METLTPPAPRAMMPVPGSIQAPFAPFELKWDSPQLTAAELALDASIEWWYFDLSTNDGVDLVVIFGRKNPMWHATKSSMYIEYKDSKTSLKRVQNFDPSEFTWTEAKGYRELRIGTNVVRIFGSDEASMRYEVTLDMPEVKASLTMTPQHRGFLPTADGCYFRGKKDPSLRSSVSFSAPLMTVNGTIAVGSDRQTVTGIGYHDHPWATEQFFWTHSEWHWGRATSAESNVMFATVTPFPEFEGTLTFLYEGRPGEFEPTVSGALTVTPSAWKKDGLFGIKFPHALQVQSAGQTWTTGFKRSLLDVPYYTRADVSWTPDDGTAAGEGWTEYWHLLASRQKLVFWTAKLAAFFWRRFPFIGR